MVSEISAHHGREGVVEHHSSQKTTGADRWGGRQKGREREIEGEDTFLY